MVQQKIVIKVQMTCEKCRTKALKIAAKTSGNELLASNSILFSGYFSIKLNTLKAKDTYKI